jgi:hypothetical protein
MHPGRIYRHSKDDNKVLLKVREKVTNNCVVPGYEAEAERGSSCFQVLLFMSNEF